MTTDIKSQICLGVELYVDCEKVLRNRYGAPTYLPTKLLVSILEQHPISSHSVLVVFQIAENQAPRSRITCLAYPSTPYGALPETFPEIPKILATDAIWSTYKLSLLF